MSYIQVKHAAKRIAGLSAQMMAPLIPGSSRRACIFVYHRVADLDFMDPRADDWNVTPAVFERHMATLAASAEVVPLLDLPEKLSQPSSTQKPLVSVTFDDGYATFHSNALPIIKRYGLPVTIFLVTSMIGQERGLTFDNWSRRNSGRVPPEVVRSMNWAEVEACMASGLVTVGAHSHTHNSGALAAPSELIEEATVSRTILMQRLGACCARAYAYPYGSTRLGQVTPEYRKAVCAVGYQMAVTTDLGLASCSSDSYALPRVEASGTDSPAVLLAKARGALAPFRITNLLRRSHTIAD